MQQVVSFIVSVLLFILFFNYYAFGFLRAWWLGLTFVQKVISCFKAYSI